MKTLKNIDVLIDEIESFGSEEYNVYSPQRKSKFVKPRVGGEQQTYTLEELQIQDQLSNVKPQNHGDDPFSTMTDFINES
jgi:hypothetical protein